MVVGSGDDMSSLAGFVRSRAPDLTWRQSAALCAIDRHALRVALAASRRRGVAFGGAVAGNVEDIELALGCGFDGVFLRRIVRDVIAVHGVIVPVPLAWIQGAWLEAECANPCTGGFVRIAGHG